MSNQPLVSAILPTYNRRRFLPAAIACFERQDYAERELIVVDDGADSVADLIPNDPSIRYIRLEKRLPIGAKRNLACREAKGGIIIHWDDDDWAATWRIRYQVEQLTAGESAICGLDHLYYFEPATERAWEYRYPSPAKPWVAGNTLCYRKSFWQDHPFLDIDLAEDARFVWQAQPEQVLRLANSRFIVAFVHESNVSPKPTTTCYWTPEPTSTVRRLMDESSAPTMPNRTRTRDIAMTSALQNDLDLPEFVAYRDKLNLPHMRTWELPYALFAARLSGAMSVLDCTINSAGFGSRLTQLYPEVHYRHWHPTQGGTFSRPAEFADGSFDRVFCINTLEHLLQPQRELLVEDLARKLKPGGRLILTCDYYFDSMWSDPEILRAGLVRTDRSEVFNGFNRVTMKDWQSLCEPHQLRPVSGIGEDPKESDPGLFWNHPPFRHASIGGVFQKEGPVVLPRSSKVMLSLLTWNTRQASLDSVDAYLKEAEMLERLGHEPLICICDNGSDDGTAPALGALDASIRFPHRFILNPVNLGNSIARNQIISYALESGADYLMMMDGDIEIVPFSSFAMLRYLESQGIRAGCIGACSQGQTPIRDRTSKSLFSIDARQVQSTDVVAWTQYGLFRRAVFEDGVRFDELGPFGGPGWGYEDNDLAFQMEMRGYRNDYFPGMIYLHRNVRSSISNLRRDGHDANKLCQSRKQYLVEKWTSYPAISAGPLEHIRRCSIAL